MVSQLPSSIETQRRGCRTIEDSMIRQALPGLGAVSRVRDQDEYLDRDDISDRQRIVWWLVLLRLGTLKYMRRLVGLLVVIWLAIGVVAVGQRGYFGSSPQNCAGVATVAVTVVAGPMNYLGVNPKVKCRLPQPSG